MLTDLLRGCSQTGRIVLVAAAGAMLGAAAMAAEGPVVAVTGGKVQGVMLPAPGGAVFKGIPFAAPPVGDLRWREPMPVKAWTGMLQTAEFRPGCGQTVPGGADGA